MNVLWLVSMVLPQAAAACGLAGASDVSGGWLTGQLTALQSHQTCTLRWSAWTHSGNGTLRHAGRCGLPYRLPSADDAFAALLKQQRPDLVHIWGTEYAAAAAMQHAAAALACRY